MKLLPKNKILIQLINARAIEHPKLWAPPDPLKIRIDDIIRVYPNTSDIYINSRYFPFNLECELSSNLKCAINAANSAPKPLPDLFFTKPVSGNLHIHLSISQEDYQQLNHFLKYQSPRKVSVQNNLRCEI